MYVTDTVTDTTKLLAESHSIVYGQASENTETDVTLGSIHFLLIQMNAKLSNIELKNDSLENRMTAIENEMRLLNEV
jgi:hypothetical protein